MCRRFLPPPVPLVSFCFSVEAFKNVPVDVVLWIEKVWRSLERLEEVKGSVLLSVRESFHARAQRHEVVG